MQKASLGDCILTPEIQNLEIALYDIDAVRLEDSRMMLENISANVGRNVPIVAYQDRREALRGAKYVVNAIQVGGYDPCTITDFEIPKKYGLRQTIADTLGIGGIFRALRTIPVLESLRRIWKMCAPMRCLSTMQPHGNAQRISSAVYEYSNRWPLP